MKTVLAVFDRLVIALSLGLIVFLIGWRFPIAY